MQNLRRELVEWLAVLAERRAALAPHDFAFEAAHRRVADACLAWGRGPLGDPARKAKRLKLYDQRMAAGHAAHPFRVAVREAERVVRAIRDEMKELGE